MQFSVIVKASSGPRYVVSYRPALPAEKLKTGTRVSLDMTTLTIMRILPREVDPLVYKMSLEDPGGATFAGIGGLGEQVRELREVCPTYIAQRDRSTDRHSGYRAAPNEPRALPPRGHQTSQRCPFVRAPWNRKDFTSKSGRRNTEHKLPQSRFISNRRQVHRRVGACDPRDVWLCKRPRAMYHLHGRN